MFLKMIEAAIWANYLFGPSVLSTQHDISPPETVIASPWFDQESTDAAVHYTVTETTDAFALQNRYSLQIGRDTLFEPTLNPQLVLFPLEREFERPKAHDAFKVLTQIGTEEALITDSPIQSLVLLAHWKGEKDEAIKTPLLPNDAPPSPTLQRYLDFPPAINRDRLPGNQFELVWTGNSFELRYYEYVFPKLQRCIFSAPVFRTETIPLTVHSNESEITLRPMRPECHRSILIVVSPHEMVVSFNSR